MARRGQYPVPTTDSNKGLIPKRNAAGVDQWLGGQPRGVCSGGACGLCTRHCQHEHSNAWACGGGTTLLIGQPVPSYLLAVHGSLRAVALMLSIGKLGRGSEGYYLRAVAAGVEDYYLGSGETSGEGQDVEVAGIESP